MDSPAMQVAIELRKVDEPPGILHRSPSRNDAHCFLLRLSEFRDKQEVTSSGFDSSSQPTSPHHIRRYIRGGVQ